MTPERAKAIVDQFEEDELKAILGFAYSNFSGGVSLKDADAHFAAGCDHLKQMRASVLPIIAEKFKE